MKILLTATGMIISVFAIAQKDSINTFSKTDTAKIFTSVAHEAPFPGGLKN